MNRHLIYTFGFISVFCLSCENEKSKTQAVAEKDYYSNGKIKTIRSVINDSIIDGKYEEYYPNGGKKTEVLYQNNIKNGSEISFYASGAVKTQLRWENGVKAGEAYIYYEDKRIQAYLFYNKDGDLIYKRYYNSDGTWEKDEGTGIIYSSIKGKEFKKGDTLINVLTIANPPQCYKEFFVTDVDKNGNIINPRKLDIKGTKISHSALLNNSGETKFGYKLILIDSISSKTKEYLYGVKIPVKVSEAPAKR